MSRQLSRLAESAQRVGNPRGRSHCGRFRAVVGSVGRLRSWFWIQHVGTARYAVRCFVGRAGDRVIDAGVGGRTRSDLSRLRRGAFQSVDCRTDRATASSTTDSNGSRFGQRDQRGLAVVDPSRGSQRPGDAGVSGVADRGQSRIAAFGRSVAEQLVRIASAGRPVGGDHVSFVGRQIGQNRVSG